MGWRGRWLGLLVTGVSGWAQAQAPAPPPFTAAQARAGQKVFAIQCVSCHRADLAGSVYAPPLKGNAFTQKYFGKPADALFTELSTRMPPARPGALDTKTYSSILAYLLKENGLKPGARPLPADPAVISSLALPRMGSGRGAPLQIPMFGWAPTATRPQPAKLPNPLDKITPVTEAMLINPPVGDWLSWRRTYDEQGFSPLKQINTQSVSRLGVAWSWTLPSGNNEITPLVHDGVLFLEGGDKVEALNAKTGDLLWVYARRLPSGVIPERKKAMAIYGERLFVGTSDAHLVALDVKSGKVIWDTKVTDYRQQGKLTGGPLVAKGKVLVGISRMGIVLPNGPAIVGLDINSGKILWRLRTIAKPGEPGGNSWGGIPYEKRTGASVWSPASYDPKLGLAYFGTGNTYDTGPLLHPAAGDTSQALYTDSTLAVDPDTGKLVWHFQHLPNDQWDLDWAFERILIPLRFNGVTRTLAVTSGKQALYDALDAETGQYAFSMDLGLQNVVIAINPETGAKTINPQVIPGQGRTIRVCPSAAGAKSWMPASYDASTHVLFVAVAEACNDMSPAPDPAHANYSSGYNTGLSLRAGADSNYGRVEALNLATRQVVWTHRQHAPPSSGVLATAGGVAFVVSLDRMLRAYDQATGRVLWQFRLNDVASAAPMSYMVDGQQYLAVMVGPGTFQSFFFLPLIPEYPPPPDRGNQLWVFALR